MKNKIAFYRENRGLSQYQLADMAETTAATISRLESGDRQLTEKWAMRLAPVLGVQPYQLLASSDTVEANVGVSVVGAIGIGVWQDREHPAEPSKKLAPVIPEPAFGKCEGFEVSAASGIECAPRGSYIIASPDEEPAPGALAIGEVDRGEMFSRIAGVISYANGTAMIKAGEKSVEVKPTHIVRAFYTPV